MNKQINVTFFVLIMLAVFSISATAQSTHSVWTNENGKGIYDAETGCKYSIFDTFNMATSWTEPSPPLYPAVAHFRGTAAAFGNDAPCTPHTYEFTLDKTTSTTNDEIVGAWNVYRDGVLMCSGCSGTAFGLSLPAGGPGNYYKLYVDDPVYGPMTWLFSGYIDARKSF